MRACMWSTSKRGSVDRDRVNRDSVNGDSVNAHLVLVEEGPRVFERGGRGRIHPDLTPLPAAALEDEGDAELTCPFELG